MYITSEELSRILNIKLDSFFKFMRDNGFRKKDEYHHIQLRCLYSMLDSNSYKCQVIRMKLLDVISSLEDKKGCHNVK